MIIYIAGRRTIAAEKTCTPGPVDRCPSTHTIYYNIRNNSKTTCRYLPNIIICIVSGIAVSLGSLDKKTNTTAHTHSLFPVYDLHTDGELLLPS